MSQQNIKQIYQAFINVFSKLSADDQIAFQESTLSKHASFQAFFSDFSIDYASKCTQLATWTESIIQKHFGGKEQKIQEDTSSAGMGETIEAAFQEKGLKGQVSKLQTAILQLSQDLKNKSDQLTKQQKQFSEQLEEAKKQLQNKRIEEVVINDLATQTKSSMTKLMHKQTLEIVEILQCRNSNNYPEFVYGHSAPGCGKTMMGEIIAEILKVAYYPFACSPDTTKSNIVGFRNQITGKYMEGVAYKAYKEGGLLCLDEVDKSNPSVLAGACNGLENRYYSFGEEIVERHPNFYLVAWANTKGTGATGGFASNKIDMATLDRFTMVEIEYDDELEREICKMIMGDDSWAIYVQKVRQFIDKENAQSIYVTTRTVRAGATYLAKGKMSVEKIAARTLFKLANKDTIRAVLDKFGVYKKP